MRFLRRYGPIVPLLALIVVGTYILTRWAGEQADDLPRVRPLQTLVVLRAAPPADQPAARYPALDPRIIGALERSSGYGPPALELVPGIAPIGAYLPRSGDALLELPFPTATLTPLPFPTPTPMPIPVSAPTALPPPVIVTAAPSLVPASVQREAIIAPMVFSYYPTTIPNAAAQRVAECAPRGFPVSGVLTQRLHASHPGIDLGVPRGTPVVATHSGMVVFAGWSEVGYGYLVVIQAGRFITYYAHNSALNVQAGKPVQVGAVIAFSGSTGNSSGPHVHYETRIDDIAVDPLTFETRGYAAC
ncbi:MAG: M23 family metallopeptidase [Anaerolineae bacterium]|nr:M23 family metallopeptidase [Anaerolineae bacterium]MDW8173972.1 M23 family metallopeptidase [Anaerolineae bacterium]